MEGQAHAQESEKLEEDPEEGGQFQALLLLCVNEVSQ